VITFSQVRQARQYNQGALAHTTNLKYELK